MTDEQRPLVLKISGLSHAFGKVRAVDQLDMTVREGEIYGFLGRNGAGKTTTIRMLMGILRPDSGNIELFGKAVRRTDMAEKRRIGYVSQDQYFYPWMTCLALGRFVSGFYPTWDTGEYDRLLKVLDLPEKRKVSALSSGMKIKLALALALAHRPAMLILDEPTSGLDPVTRREFLDMIRHQARTHQRTTFFSSHLIDEVERVADRIGIINKGRLYYEGDIQTLRNSVRRVRLQPEADEKVPAAEPASKTPEAMDQELQASGESSLEDPGGDSGNRIKRSRIMPLVDRGIVRILREEKENGGRSLILSGSSQAWAGSFPPGTLSELSLEDIFIAITREVTPAL